MTIGHRLCLLIIILLIALPATGQRKEIIGYYPSWKWANRNHLVTPKTIPYAKLTMINYAFFYPSPDGGITGIDTLEEVEQSILLGERDSTTGLRLRETSLIHRAHAHGVKVMLSIGGWTGSSEFPAVAADPAKRAAFGHACARQIVDYGFDGIDIDWEFPGYAQHKGTPNDKATFTLLLQAIRDSLDALGKQTRRRYLLTAALPAGRRHAANIEVEKVTALLDYLNLMTYDFFSSWGPMSNHNAPLYAPAKGDSLFNVDGAFRLYHVKYGVPAGKINLGAPFYGYTFKNCSALHAPHSGSDAEHFPGDGFFYHDIVTRLPEFTRFWDEKAKVPYLVHNTWKTLVSYDDEESIGLKAQYVLDKNAAGLIIWEITGDYMPDAKTPLLDAIHSRFANPANRGMQ
ncbi:MAG TPA: hypothetical protein DCP63_07880 [Bacteroidetes bacterium]|nr:hypothetical protein [Bacteroidota bacterium]